MGHIPWDIVWVVFVRSDLIVTTETRHFGVGWSCSNRGALEGALGHGLSCLNLTIFYGHGG